MVLVLSAWIPYWILIASKLSLMLLSIYHGGCNITEKIHSNFQNISENVTTNFTRTENFGYVSLQNCCNNVGSILYA